MSIQKKLQSLSYSFNGLKIAWTQEFNFRAQVGCAITALAFAWYFEFSQAEFLIVLLTIGFVITAETFNTVIEELCDKFQSEHDPHIAKIKDISAAAVFLSMLTAFGVGLLLYVPHFFALIPWNS